MNKLIFIDDCKLDHFILKKILKKYQLQYDVSCTEDAEEVLSFLSMNSGNKNELPDVILLDIYMPNLDGWEFLEKIKSLYPRLAKQLKIYILSSSINPKDITRSKNYEFVHSFLFKPITNEVLQRIIDAETSGAA